MHFAPSDPISSTLGQGSLGGKKVEVEEALGLVLPLDHAVIFGLQPRHPGRVLPFTGLTIRVVEIA